MSTEQISVLHMPSIALGPGAALEAGYHLTALGVTRVFLVTDAFLLQSGLVTPIEAAVRADGLDVVVYAVPTGEPTEDSMREVAEACVASGADGILGVGANTAGPGPAPIPTAVMPGELSNGVLIYQNAYPFGLGGYMILGPNLFPTKVSLPGAPDAYVKVSVNGGPKQNGSAIIDSGGVYGTLNRSLYPGSPVGTNVPAGTKIDVYAPDGTTLLYSYTTQAGDAATPFIDSGLFNTGNAPYEQNPIYLNYATTPYGIGSTDFSIY